MHAGFSPKSDPICVTVINQISLIDKEHDFKAINEKYGSHKNSKKERNMMHPQGKRLLQYMHHPQVGRIIDQTTSM